MNIGEVIKEYRIRRNLTQEELATKLNLTPQAVSRWETGISYPDIAMLPMVARVLQVSTDELVGLRPVASERKNSIEQREDDIVLNQSEVDCIFDYTVKEESRGGEKLLIIDDAEFMRTILTDILTTHNYEVHVAEDGEKGLEMLQKNTFDICILDIGMPGMDGLQVLEIIKERHPDVKVVMLSARSTKGNVMKALQLGAYGFVAKPFAEGSLREHLY